MTLTASGHDFTLSGLGRSYSSQQCWESLPSLGAQSHSATPATVRTSCKMPAGDPRQATVITTWAVRENTIYFDETGQYQLVAEKTNCTASVRRTRVLERIVSAPVAAPVAVSVPTAPPVATPIPSAAAPPAPAQASICMKPGRAVSLELSPKTKLMRAGESFTFRAEARDAGGCRVLVQPRWSIRTGQALGSITADGRLTVAPNAPSGALTLAARVEEKVGEVGARVVAEAEYERLLAGGGFGVQGESLDHAVVTLTSSEVSVDPVDEEAPKASRKGALALLAGAVSLAGVALFLVLRKPRLAGRARAPLSEPPEAMPTHAPVVAQPAAPALESTAVAELAPTVPGKVCPVCARTYPRESTFCGQDGARLVRVN